MKLFSKHYNIKTEKKKAIKMAEKQVTKCQKLIDKYHKKFKRTNDTRKMLMYSAIKTAYELELETALNDLKQIKDYYKRMILI